MSTQAIWCSWKDIIIIFGTLIGVIGAVIAITIKNV